MVGVWARLFFCVALMLAFGRMAFAFDEFDAVHAPARFTLSVDDLTLEIKGRMRLGLHDLEGSGGPGYDSPTDTATIGTRSPFVELDSFDLAFRVRWKDLLWLNTNVQFLTTGASLSAIYFEYRQVLSDWFEHAVEVGYKQPIVARHRHTVRYPFIATNYWKNPGHHVAYGAKFVLSDETSVSVLASLSLMRPLKAETIHGSPTYRGSFSTLSYGNAEPFSGNAPAGTGLVRFSTHGFLAEGFGFVGKLVTKSGIHVLIADFPYYRHHPSFDPNETEGAAYWYGGRLGYEGYGAHFLAEAIASREHLLSRVGMYAQGGYAYAREGAFWFNEFAGVVRYEQTWLLDSTKPFDESYALRSPEVLNAISWDYQAITLAMRIHIMDTFLALRCEYTFFIEHNGVPALGQKNLNIKNNELLIQLEARY